MVALALLGLIRLICMLVDIFGRSLVSAAAMEFVHANGPFHNKTKVIFVLGSTGCGKTKLSIDLATRYNGEIINSDKIQVYKGLDIVTNKATKPEQRGILHHLLGSIQDPEADFTVQDFCLQVPKALDEITKRNRVPIIAGGSNTYIEALVEDPTLRFQDKYDCCFIWLDVSLPVLYNRVSERVDEMVDAGLVDELREMFGPGADYERGIRRAIGAPEMHAYFMAEMDHSEDEAGKEFLFKDGIQKTKDNTLKLAESQVQKIERLRTKWDIHRIDVTAVHESRGKKAVVAWENLVLKPSFSIVSEFLEMDG
ncbi:hypothetical protein L3X38_027191 [Prunus dulcis]|uniref:adenylate dimethylallyltransferase (ADP/ATP-dependent) n=1 Tax=Prunus dulcis TaxID=3755 RepID=A0AAD4VMD5_PRUDU|nr:hypothetical protein L3X38_027191 [Prunus dulcis]